MGCASSRDVESPYVSTHLQELSYVRPNKQANFKKYSEMTSLCFSATFDDIRQMSIHVEYKEAKDSRKKCKILGEPDGVHVLIRRLELSKFWNPVPVIQQIDGSCVFHSMFNALTSPMMLPLLRDRVIRVLKKRRKSELEMSVALVVGSVILLKYQLHSLSRSHGKFVRALMSYVNKLIARFDELPEFLKTDAFENGTRLDKAIADADIARYVNVRFRTDISYVRKILGYFFSADEVQVSQHLWDDPPWIRVSSMFEIIGKGMGHAMATRSSRYGDTVDIVDSNWEHPIRDDAYLKKTYPLFTHYPEEGLVYIYVHRDLAEGIPKIDVTDNADNLNTFWMDPDMYPLWIDGSPVTFTDRVLRLYYGKRNPVDIPNSEWETLPPKLITYFLKDWIGGDLIKGSGVRDFDHNNKRVTRVKRMMVLKWNGVTKTVENGDRLRASDGKIETIFYSQDVGKPHTDSVTYRYDSASFDKRSYIERDVPGNTPEEEEMQNFKHTIKDKNINYFRNCVVNESKIRLTYAIVSTIATENKLICAFIIEWTSQVNTSTIQIRIHIPFDDQTVVVKHVDVLKVDGHRYKFLIECNNSVVKIQSMDISDINQRDSAILQYISNLFTGAYKNVSGWNETIEMRNFIRDECGKNNEKLTELFENDMKHAANVIINVVRDEMNNLVRSPSRPAASSARSPQTNAVISPARSAASPARSPQPNAATSGSKSRSASSSARSPQPNAATSGSKSRSASSSARSPQPNAAASGSKPRSAASSARSPQPNAAASGSKPRSAASSARSPQPNAATSGSKSRSASSSARSPQPNAATSGSKSRSASSSARSPQPKAARSPASGSKPRSASSPQSPQPKAARSASSTQSLTDIKTPHAMTHNLIDQLNGITNAQYDHLIEAQVGQNLDSAFPYLGSFDEMSLTLSQYTGKSMLSMMNNAPFFDDDAIILKDGTHRELIKSMDALIEHPTDKVVALGINYIDPFDGHAFLLFKCSDASNNVHIGIFETFSTSLGSAYSVLMKALSHQECSGDGYECRINRTDSTGKDRHVIYSDLRKLCGTDKFPKYHFKTARGHVLCIWIALQWAYHNRPKCKDVKSMKHVLESSFVMFSKEQKLTLNHVRVRLQTAMLALNHTLINLALASGLFDDTWNVYRDNSIKWIEYVQDRYHIDLQKTIEFGKFT
jgi:hypothetical protein